MSEGKKHWWQQRITSVILIPLTIWFITYMSLNFGKPYIEIKSSLEEPFNAIAMSLFLIATFFHLQQGLQVIIEDYFYKRFWIILNSLACGFLLVIGLFSLIKLVLLG